MVNGSGNKSLLESSKKGEEIGFEKHKEISKRMVLYVDYKYYFLYFLFRSAVFASVGTAGQRCTTLRRLILHEKIHDEVLNYLTFFVNQCTEIKSLSSQIIHTFSVFRHL
jgi:hypothetical protein